MPCLSVCLSLSASYDTVAAATKDPLILAKLQFYTALARTFTPFLKKYQTDEPVLPFLPEHLTELMMVIIYLKCNSPPNHFSLLINCINKCLIVMSTCLVIIFGILIHFSKFSTKNHLISLPCS